MNIAHVVLHCDVSLKMCLNVDCGWTDVSQEGSHSGRCLLPVGLVPSVAGTGDDAEQSWLGLVFHQS
jgi:hypothetical protein